MSTTDETTTPPAEPTTEELQRRREQELAARAEAGEAPIVPTTPAPNEDAALEEEREDEAREDETDEPSAGDAALIEAAGKPEPVLFACPTCKGEGKVPVPEDPHTRPCPVCYGQGRVLTGSSVQTEEARECPRCRGAGYLEQQREPGEETADERKWRPPNRGTVDW